jgi:hypothetical protein
MASRELSQIDTKFHKSLARQARMYRDFDVKMKPFFQANKIEKSEISSIIYGQILTPEVMKATPFEFIDRNKKSPFSERYIRAKIQNCASIIFEVDIVKDEATLLLNDLSIDYSSEFTIESPDLLWCQ